MEGKKFGILASIDWNSNKWQESPTKEDLEKIKFGFVEENNKTYTAINFGHEKYPTDENGYYAGLLPQLFTRTPDKEKSKSVNIVVLKATNWKDNKTYIVGFYAFPIFEKGKKTSPIKSFTEDFETNIKSFPHDIYLLENPIQLNNDNEGKFLPEGKKLGKQGYNYLTKENVINILDAMTDKNDFPKLRGTKIRLLESMK